MLSPPSEESGINPVSPFSTLPTELVSQILLYNLYTTKHQHFTEFNSPEASRLSLVCRGFHAIIADNWYSRCCVNLYTSQLDDGRKYPAVEGYMIGFGRFGRSRDKDFAAAGRRFESYKAHGQLVRLLIFIHGLMKFDEYGTPGPRGPVLKPYNKDLLFTTDPYLPAFTTPFTTSFPNLTTIIIMEYNYHTYPQKPEYLLASLTSIMSSCHCLKHLTLSLAIDLFISPSLAEEIKSLPLITKPAALLETLTLNISLRNPRYVQPPPGPFFGIWFLSTLATILHASTITLKELNFDFPRYSPIAQLTSIELGDLDTGDSSKNINPLDRAIPFPNLHRLTTSVQQGCFIVFSSFMDVNKDTVRELNIENASYPDYGDDNRAMDLLGKFPNIHTLQINKMSPQYPDTTYQFIKNIAVRFRNLRTIILYILSGSGETQGNMEKELLGGRINKIEFKDITDSQRHLARVEFQLYE